MRNNRSSQCDINVSTNAFSEAASTLRFNKTNVMAGQSNRSWCGKGVLLRAAKGVSAKDNRIC